ncbi:hypothetical protein Q1695_015673 [Nippostrongylus brasiliensis]|nr:hypothetical protein Q1695_015673 [Nippostrongylus brasiliensis]
MRGLAAIAKATAAGGQSAAAMTRYCVVFRERDVLWSNGSGSLRTESSDGGDRTLLALRAVVDLRPNMASAVASEIASSHAANNNNTRSEA